MKYTAILIDDEAWTRSALRKLGNWAELNIDIVAEAADGEYGMELIKMLNPDIIVTDVKMPKMTGIELTKVLRESGNNAKVIFVSGFSEFDYIRSAVKLQAIDYLLKPIKPEELNEQLARCINEIGLRNKGIGNHRLDLQGFMNVEWESEYSSFKEAIYDALHSEDPAVMQNKFGQFIDFIYQKKQDDLPKSTAISIYYDFHFWLQRHIMESGYTVSDIFPEKRESFVFDHNFSLITMLESIKALYENAQKNIVQLRKSQNRIDIGRIKQFINANYCKGITLEETAAKHYISKEYLSKIFKQETGINFSSYVLELRMRKAKDLLIRDKVPIKEIAVLTGYSDHAHFHKAFKKYYGITPGEAQSGRLKLKN